MRTQRQSDGQTVAIASALGLFVLMLVVGSLVLWAADVTLELPEQFTHVLFLTLAAVAGTSTVVY